MISINAAFSGRKAPNEWRYVRGIILEADWASDSDYIRRSVRLYRPDPMGSVTWILEGYALITTKEGTSQ